MNLIYRPILAYTLAFFFLSSITTTPNLPATNVRRFIFLLQVQH